jgi:hypothetical protein
MKTLIAAVIASAVSFGAYAQTSPAATAASGPMAKSTDSSSEMKKAPAHKASKKHAAKKSSKKASAPAA